MEYNSSEDDSSMPKIASTVVVVNREINQQSLESEKKKWSSIEREARKNRKDITQKILKSMEDEKQASVDLAAILKSGADPPQDLYDEYIYRREYTNDLVEQRKSIIETLRHAELKGAEAREKLREYKEVQQQK